MSLPYLFHANIILTLLVLLYQVTFQRDNRLALNRFMLIGIPIASFTLPLLPALPLANSTVLQFNNVISVAVPSKPATLLPFYFIVTLILITRLALQHIHVWQIIRNSDRHRRNGVILCTSKTPTVPFSWFRYIVVGQETSEPILTHETAHSRQWHSLDLLLAEIVCCICWINPFAYLYRRALRLHVEFLADKAVADTGADLQDYQHSLLKYALGSSAHRAITGFSSSRIRRRITMMNTPKNISPYKYLLPIISLFVLYLSLNADRPMSGISIDASTETVRISLVPDKIVRVKFKGIYLIGDKQYNETELRKMLDDAGEITIPMARRPILAYFTPGDETAMARWGDKAAGGVILVRTPDK